MKERLQKLISAAGLCSRRRAEEWIAQGKVTVNGGLARLGDSADPETDLILIDGQPLPAAPAETVTVREYLTACYGTTEYPEDMSSLTLHVEAGEEESVTIPYEYRCREAAVPGAEEVSCTLPPIKTRVSMLANGRDRVGFVREGYAFSPMFTLGWERKLREQEVFTTWLRLERAD